jgi:hypothetical protein
MREVGIDLAGRMPTKLTKELLTSAGVTAVFTMGCGDKCPFGESRQGWGGGLVSAGTLFLVCGDNLSPSPAPSSGRQGRGLGGARPPRAERGRGALHPRRPPRPSAGAGARAGLAASRRHRRACGRGGPTGQQSGRHQLIGGHWINGHPQPVNLFPEKARQAVRHRAKRGPMKRTAGGVQGVATNPSEACACFGSQAQRQPERQRAPRACPPEGDALSQQERCRPARLQRRRAPAPCACAACGASQL